MNAAGRQTRPLLARRGWLLVLLGAGLFSAAPLLRRWRGPASTGADFELHSRPRDLAGLRFSDGQGIPTSLEAFRGRVVLLNVWATWCPPCREEMPTLDRLQATLGGPGFEVVALSIDQGGLAVVQSFFQRTGIQHLQPYLDSSGDAMARLVATGVPLTLLIDREGREVGRKLGPAVWDDPKILALIRHQIASGESRSPPMPDSR